MIYLDLFLGFLRVGCFAFGGAYAAIPLIREVVLSYGWLSDEALSYIIAVSESTPGPIMVNVATYVGSSQGGILGAALATLAVILPAFIIILLLTLALKTAMKNKYVKAVINGIKPCVIGIVLAMGISMIIKNCIFSGGNIAFDISAIIITACLFAIMLGVKLIFKKKLSPITLIIISAILGIIVYSI